jgi:hypothetical protein
MGCYFLWARGNFRPRDKRGTQQAFGSLVPLSSTRRTDTMFSVTREAYKLPVAKPVSKYPRIVCLPYPNSLQYAQITVRNKDEEDQANEALDDILFLRRHRYNYEVILEPPFLIQEDDFALCNCQDSRCIKEFYLAARTEGILAWINKLGPVGELVVRRRNLVLALATCILEGYIEVAGVTSFNPFRSAEAPYTEDEGTLSLSKDEVLRLTRLDDEDSDWESEEEDDELGLLKASRSKIIPQDLLLPSSLAQQLFGLNITDPCASCLFTTAINCTNTSYRLGSCNS